jgi:adenylate cyclase
MRGLLQRALPALVLIVALTLRVAFPAMTEFQYRVFDLFQRIAPRQYVDAPVKVVDIDNDTLAKYGQWPWPRSQTALLIDRMREAGAVAIALDMVFSEPDRTSPRQAIASWGIPADDPRAKDLVANVPDPDALLAAAIKKAPVVTGFVLTGSGSTDTLKTKGIASAGRMDLKAIIAESFEHFEGALTNLPDLQKAGKGNGSVNAVPDGDGVVRRVPLVFAAGGKLRPSLVSEALRVALKAPSLLVKARGFGNYQLPFLNDDIGKLFLKQGIGEVLIGPVSILTDPQGRMWLYDTGRVAQRVIPAWRLLDGEKIDLSGQILFLGTSAPGLLDLRVSPSGQTIPGVEIHAQITEQILTGHYLRRTLWADFVEVAALIVLGVSLVLLLPKVGPVGSTFIGGVAVAIGVSASLFAFIRYGYLFDPVIPSVAALLVFLSALLSSYFRSDLERKRVRSAFGQYLAPEMVERLAADPSHLKLGGEIKQITILFCDIRDFTTISERTDAESLTTLLNDFLTPMTEAVLSNGGTIDKYIGDSIMAFWNAPVDDPDHAAHACRAALDMRSRLAGLNRELGIRAVANNTPFEPIRIGIGINSGPCCVGNLGSRQRFNYSVLGDDVNLASRVEGVTKNYGVDILIGENTRALAPDFATVEMGEVLVKGKVNAARLHALIGTPEMAADPRFRLLATLIGEVAAAVRIGDTRAAERFLLRCRETDQTADLAPFYEHFGAAIERHKKVREKSLDFG